MLLILMVTEMMVLMMTMTMSMEIMMLGGPGCEFFTKSGHDESKTKALKESRSVFVAGHNGKVARQRLRSEREETHHLA